MDAQRELLERKRGRQTDVASGQTNSVETSGPPIS